MIPPWQMRGTAGVLARVALLPAEALWRIATGARNRLYDRGVIPAVRVPGPVISVGNLLVGGAGKTPFAAWLAGRLHERGRAPAIALRGYGNDEVLLHRALNPAVPVFAAARRVRAARDALATAANVVVLDDGFQHRRLARDLDVVLVPAESWTASPRLLPRGPWRESPRALARAHVIVVTRKTASRERAREVAELARAFAPGAAFATLALLPRRLVPLHGGDAAPLGTLDGRAVSAVAGLADPGPFFAQLRELGALVRELRYRDHHPFTAADAAAIAGLAPSEPVVMTAKDAVKLRPLLPAGTPAFVLEQTVEIESGADALDGAIRAALVRERR